MAERKEKQANFEKQRIQRQQNILHIKHDKEHMLTIYTYGYRKRKFASKNCQRNFDVRDLTFMADNKSELKNKTGMDMEIQEAIFNKFKFQQYICHIIKTVEKNKLSNISICCHLGIHRCVAIAEIIKEKFYPKATIHHIELGIDYC